MGRGCQASRLMEAPTTISNLTCVSPKPFLSLPPTHALSLPPPSKPCSDLIVEDGDTDDDQGYSEDSNAAQDNTGPHCCPGGCYLQRHVRRFLYGRKMDQGDLSDPRLTPQDGENEGTVGLRVPG